MVWLRAIAVEANATSVVEGRGKNTTTGGDDAYDITQNASWIDTAGGATHRCEAKATAATEGRRDRMQRRGRNQSYDGAWAADARRVEGRVCVDAKRSGSHVEVA
jgi:hypothetical protein